MNDEDPLSNESNNEAAEFSPDGKLLAAGCGDAHVRVLSVPEGEIVKDFELYGGVCEGYKECEVEAVCWTIDGKYIIAVGNNHVEAQVIEYATGRIVTKLVQANEQDAIAVSNDGQFMVVAANEDVVIYKTSDWSQVKRLTPTGDGAINSLAFSPDDRYLATGGNRGHVGVLSVPGFDVLADLHDGSGYVGRTKAITL